MVKKVLAVHDISCFGRCSMQVIIPVLSRFGLQVCPLPTALLSTHTGDFDDFTFLDLTDEMKKITCHWKSLGLKFDSVYSGFLGNEKQIQAVCDAISEFAKDDALILTDPVMGDNGKIYATYTPEMCSGMKQVCKNAHILTPNLTEACILAGMEYDPAPDGQKIDLLLEKVSAISSKASKAVLLHGVPSGSTISTYYIDSLTASHKTGRIDSKHCPAFFPGCGDLFASLLLGQLISGTTVEVATKKAADFISEISFDTLKLGTPTRQGVEFEDKLRGFEI